MSFTADACFMIRLTMFPHRIINLGQQMRQKRVIRLFWIQSGYPNLLCMISAERKTCAAVTQPVDLFLFHFFCMCTSTSLCWTLRVPQLSHWLFRVSIALFGLQNAATLQQRFPLLNSLRNVYPHTLTSWGGPRKERKLMGISCKCSAVCMLRCKLKNTEEQRCDLKFLH